MSRRDPTRLYHVVEVLPHDPDAFTPGTRGAAGWCSYSRYCGALAVCDGIRSDGRRCGLCEWHRRYSELWDRHRVGDAHDCAACREGVTRRRRPVPRTDSEPSGRPRRPVESYVDRMPPDETRRPRRRRPQRHSSPVLDSGTTPALQSDCEPDLPAVVPGTDTSPLAVPPVDGICTPAVIDPTYDEVDAAGSEPDAQEDGAVVADTDHADDDEAQEGTELSQPPADGEVTEHGATGA